VKWGLHLCKHGPVDEWYVIKLNLATESDLGLGLGLGPRPLPRDHQNFRNLARMHSRPETLVSRSEDWKSC